MALQNLCEKEALSILTAWTKDKENWEENMPQVPPLFQHSSSAVVAKALWLFGEMGLLFPHRTTPFVPAIVEMMKDENDKIRERAVGALGRIGRGDGSIVYPYIDRMMEKASDGAPLVRMNCIWAAENIATRHPEAFAAHMDHFAALLEDTSIRVRIEAPEIFRVVAKQRPDMVLPYLEILRRISLSDEDRVVRIHCAGALKAAMANRSQPSP